MNQKQLSESIGMKSEKSLIFLLTGDKKALFSIVTLSYVIFTLLAVKNFYLGYNLLGLSLLLFVFVASLDTYCFYRERPKPININIVISTLVLSIFLTIYYMGLSAAYWAFPISVVFVYLLSATAQIVFNLLILSFVFVYSLLEVQIAEALRLSSSLLLTILFSTLITRHVQKLHHKVMYDAIKDPMTGAFNRRQLTLQLEQNLSHKLRNNTNSAILMLDIDHFKQINDTYGHDIGDDVLKSVVRIIDECSRHSDLLFRLGGEEFLLLMHGINDVQAQAFAEKLRQRIAESNIIADYPITVSIGVCTASDDHNTDTWLKSADTALYQAKNSGRNQVQLFKKN